MKYMNCWEVEFEEKMIWFKDPYDASQSAHSIIILTDWDE